MKKLLNVRVFWSAFIAALITFFVPRYITYDTEIRCVEDACPEASADTSLFGWLWEAQPKMIDADYYIPIVGFFVYFAIAYLLYPAYKKFRNRK